MTTHHHDLIVLGAGSGNTLIDERFADLDVAVIERRRFGGTCLNVGCIPTKMFAYTADIASAVESARTFDLDASLRGVDWRALHERIFSRLDGVASAGRVHRVDDNPNVTVYEGNARFTGHKTLRVDLGDGEDVTVSAAQIVLAAGARPLVPEPVASSSVRFETSDTVMHMDRLPARLAILGGGYIAAEFAHVFAHLGSRVTVIDMADELLAGQDESIVAAYNEVARQRYDVRVGRKVDSLTQVGDGVRLTLDDGQVVEADTLLVAVGRVPNADELELDSTGVKIDDAGRVVVDAYQRTGVPGIFALGDMSSPVQLKHVANRQAKVVAHNLLHPDDLMETDMDVIPAAIFTEPQIASVGLTEQDCRDEGTDYLVGTQTYSDVAYGWAMEDTTGFCKVLVDGESGRILGAHIFGAQASTLIQPLVLAMCWGIEGATLARRPYWIHPALTEVIENALLHLKPPTQ